MENKISIIIITYNEEKTISGILKDLTKQSFQNFEIIISDSNSCDKTEQITNKFKNKFKEFSFYNFKKTIGPSYGRNYGAKKAKYENLFFFDADTRLEDKDFFKKSINYINKKNLDAGSFYLKSNSNSLFEKLSYGFFNFGFWITQFLSPTACGAGMFSKKTSFKKINGFHNDVSLCEDCDFARDIKNNKLKFKMIKTKIIFSNRRLDEKGYFKTGFLYLKANFYRFLTGKSYKKKTDYFKDLE